MGYASREHKGRLAKVSALELHSNNARVKFYGTIREACKGRRRLRQGDFPPAPGYLTPHSTAKCACSQIQWLDSFTKPAKILFGLPAVTTYRNVLSDYYKPVPWSNLSFFSSWVQGATEWRKIIKPDDDNFDPLYTEIEVTTNGTLVIPALLLKKPYFLKDGPSAVNVGGLSHLIARSLAKRYVKPGAKIPAECLEPRGPHRALPDGVVENLLAYACVRPAMVVTGARRELDLPQLPWLTQDGIMYTFACLKDCVKTDIREAATCSFPFERMKQFDEAFDCRSNQPLCNIF
ncbi:hypothetical protein HPB48_016667 [Haemaphysalis longicornis]|uniref:Uncharacterized protein n=1 Tax=Haemaphysalis longicornis TaxID=44386 RepID=A0A9J6H026_HAELO|nr:hypothetical protein HPB48_016667 [Haemaphysalis longicornis]